MKSTKNILLAAVLAGGTLMAGSANAGLVDGRHGTGSMTTTGMTIRHLGTTAVIQGMGILLMAMTYLMGMVPHMVMRLMVMAVAILMDRPRLRRTHSPHRVQIRPADNTTVIKNLNRHTSNRGMPAHVSV